MSKSKTSPKPAIPPPPPSLPEAQSAQDPGSFYDAPAARGLSGGHVANMLDEARGTFAQPVANSSVFATPTRNGTGELEPPRTPDAGRTLADSPKAIRSRKKYAVKCRMVFRGPVPTHEFFLFVDAPSEVVHIRSAEYHTETLAVIELTDQIRPAFAAIGLL